MALSNKSRVSEVVDLTYSESDSDDGSVGPSHIAAMTAAAAARIPPTASSSRPSAVPASGRIAPTSNGHANTQHTKQRTYDRLKEVEHDLKRRKLSAATPQRGEGPRTQLLAHGTKKQDVRRGASTATPARSTPKTFHNSNLGVKLSTMKGVPSVHYMNSALKPLGTFAYDHIPAPAARPFLMSNTPQNDTVTGVPSPSPSSRAMPRKSVIPIFVDSDTEDDMIEHVQQPLPCVKESTAAVPVRQLPLSFRPPRVAGSDDESGGDSVISDIPQRRPVSQQVSTRETSIQPTSSRPTPTPAPDLDHRPPQVASATERFDHLLIFLKEVKKLKWTDITKEFTKDIPGRTYSQLQSRYSTTINKRDRTQDPPTLSLPPRFAAEATINWKSVHANTEGPRVRNEVTNLSASRGPRDITADRARPVQQIRDDDSGTDSGRQRQRTRRAPPVNYKLPKLKPVGNGFEEDVKENVSRSHSPSMAASTRSASPTDRTVVTPGAGLATFFRPLRVDIHENARLGLSVQKGLRNGRPKSMPYLSSAQRSAMRNDSQEHIWVQQSTQDWQGTVLHVDFSSAELEIVEKIVADLIRPSGRQIRHNTYQRHLRAALRNASSPKLQMLAYEIGRHLRARDSQSIAAFLEDAATGMVSDKPRVQRLALIRKSTRLSSIQDNPSVSSIVRSRELGLRAKRGWQTASTPLTYRLKNQLIDTMGPESTWTGASSDIHTVAWSPNGQYFAAGAVAVTDSDSMQYNRPNVLMYGDTVNGHIHELGEHCEARPRTEAGANSTHAMYVSQDPKLYTTVSSVAFSPSGDLMYSAGYDKTVCIWSVTGGSRQPQMARQLQHCAPVDVLAVNPRFDGIFATATRGTVENSIKLVFFDEDTVHEESWEHDVTDFASAKALSRPDLNMSATALKFDPTGTLLLAGFGANMREDNHMHTSGDICLWDVNTQAALVVHGSSRNVFDVTFNPTPRYQGLFAVGCVANGHVNRGTRSVVRFYSRSVQVSKDDVKFTCPLELECKAFDMNDIVWCPHDEKLFAAGCTDGRSYVWDLRRPDQVLYTLSHGSSLMPLQDGVPHERTDTGVRFLSWGQNARRLYSGSSDGVVKVWDVAQSQEDVFVKDLITVKSGIMSGAFTEDYSKLIIGEVNGTANLLEVGRDDIALKDADKFTYQPYLGRDDEEVATDKSTYTLPSNTAAAEARTWLDTNQLRLAPLSGLPRQQVIQGFNYQGPFDRAEDAQLLRNQADVFQRSMAMPHDPQCTVQSCKASLNTTTFEETGDSGRSNDRIPDELRQQWLNEAPRSILGRTHCTLCSRPAIPSPDAGDIALCERCSFTCFRCHAASPLTASTTLKCDACGGVWDKGALGYECIQQPQRPLALDVPPLKRFGKDAYLDRLEDVDAAFGDEVNALSDYYFGLAIVRAVSPPL
ncbi:Rik1-associated factor 1 [Boeremia exigua]|uniref:Rik1-associated factor 1 n=1 Tax=Boeremia exigua TaxID=749465 RepID=UPI001E8D893C|nr:Rik1-associated factor 1 [Boeremia exigua]KAH6642781.1 Rik1-associated factor 1 [Boeremia exigua]